MIVKRLSHNDTEVKLKGTKIKLSQIAMENKVAIENWGQIYWVATNTKTELHLKSEGKMNFSLFESIYTEFLY